jgi:EmrB/QacA subfamily drug resistance transporter
VSSQLGSELERRRWYALIVVSIGTFMTPFDASIVPVALQSLGADLQLSYSQGLWTQAAYLLMTSVLLIPAGRIADSRGLVRYYLLGTLVFALGSVVAALAPNGPVLIAARCIQGAGGAFMFSTAAAIVTMAFPAAERGRALGLNVAAVYVGLTLGPVIGGLIVSHASWRWIFFINVPIALITLLASWSLLAVEGRARQKAGADGADGARGRGSVDWLGTVVLGGALAALFVPLTFSPLWGWGDARTIGLLVLAVVLFVTFVFVENNQKEPMLDLDLVRKNRIFALGNSAGFLNYLAVFAVTTLTALFLEIAQGRSAQETGLMLLVQPVVMALLSPFSGRLSDRVGARVPATAGMLLSAAGMAQLAFASSVGRVLLALGTIGVGIAAFSTPNMSAVMGSVDRSQLSLASGFLGAMRFCGQGISVAVLGAIAAHSLGPEGGRIIFLGEAASAGSAAAFADGFQVAMLVGAALAFLGAGLSWMAAPKRAVS